MFFILIQAFFNTYGLFITERLDEIKFSSLHTKARGNAIRGTCELIYDDKAS